MVSSSTACNHSSHSSHSDRASSVWKGQWGFAVQFATIGLLAVLAAVAVNALRPDPLPWIGDYSEEARLSSPTGRKLAISLDEAFHLYERRQVLFLDARSASDYAAGHIAGALSAPVSEGEERLLQVLDGVPDSTVIITYCDGESCNLSKELAIMIEAFGFSHVHVLVNGLSVWKKAGYPIEGAS
ncbi:MAG: rhodanese-like domain-containing protein [Thermodesulfobacteriota bacterium]